jgi:hypothetical protein
MLVKHSIKIEKVNSQKLKDILDIFSYKETYEKVSMDNKFIRYKHKTRNCYGFLDKIYYICDDEIKRMCFYTNSDYDFSEFEILKETKERLLFPNLRLLSTFEYGSGLFFKYGALFSDEYFNLVNFSDNYGEDFYECSFYLDEYIELVEFVKVISSFCNGVVFVVDDSVRVCNGKVVE